MRSTNDAPPFLGPTSPTYPQVSQVVRVYGPPLAGNVYQAFIQQWNPTLQLRDREAVYVWEPNGIVLTAGFYDARLIGSYLGLPLLATWCCPQPVSSSSAGG